MKTIEHFIGGKSFSGDSKRTSKVFNPATGEQSAEVKLASTKDINQAVENAKKAFGFQYRATKRVLNKMTLGSAF